MDQTWAAMTKAVVEEAGRELWRAVELYIDIPRYPWLPRDTGIDLTPIVRSWGEWRAIWPVPDGPTVVAFTYEGTGTFDYANLAVKSNLRRKLEWQRALGEGGPIDYGPYSALGTPSWTQKHPIPRFPIFPYMNFPYRPKWVVWLLDLYAEITGRFQEAACKTENHIHKVLRENRGSLYQIFRWVDSERYCGPRTWSTVVDEAITNAQNALMRAMGEGYGMRELKLSLVHEYHPTKVAILLQLYEEMISNLKNLGKRKERENS